MSSSHGELYSNIPPSYSFCLPLFSSCSSKSDCSKLTGFDRLNFSLIEVRREVRALAIVVSCQVVTVELLVWPTGSWHVGVQDTKNLDLLNRTPPNGFSSLSLLRLYFQSSLGSLTLWKVYLCDVQPSEYSSHLKSCNSTG